jgi:hypothetical protein
MTSVLVGFWLGAKSSKLIADFGVQFFPSLAAAGTGMAIGEQYSVASIQYPENSEY